MADQTPAQPAPVADAYFNDYQRIVISGASREEKLKAYAEWAPTYDEFARGSHTPDNMARVLLDAIQQHMEPVVELRLLDAGCGTGHPGDVFKKLAADNGIHAKLVGLDYSAPMLEEAKKYGDTFERLVEADLTQPLEFDDAEFDCWYACAVLVDGHCGPEILPNIAKVVKPGSVGCATVRKKTFEARRDIYDKYLQEAGFDVLSSEVFPYGSGVEAYYLILKKN